MMFRHARLLILASAALALAVPAAAQERGTPEQRIGRVERQVRQLQKQVFPKGQPADTAGLDLEPAATQASVSGLIQRLDAVEAQLATLTRTSEENGQRISAMEADLAKLRADYEARLTALERADRPAADSSAGQDTATTDDPPSRPSAPSLPASSVTPLPNTVDGAEAAYDRGFRAWQAKRYDEAVKLLEQFSKEYPDSRRVSWANNLRGRALLDKGQPRAAAEVFLANYRGNPKGERAQDSLYYLGQSLMKLGQAGQACKAYQELDEVYGAGVRAPIKVLIPAARAEAKCS